MYIVRGELPVEKCSSSTHVNACQDLEHLNYSLPGATVVIRKQTISSGIELGAPVVHIHFQGSNELINKSRLDMPASELAA